LQLIPGLENADFLQYGQIHRNTFINSPQILQATLQTKKSAKLFFAGRSRASKATSNRSARAGSPD
jgi:methylenetetrahydrofolate--tRNA-(uracil-5-)-methyltransferase